MLRTRITPRRLFLRSFVATKSTAGGLQEALELDSNDISNGSRGTPFAASRRGSFFQEAPKLGNQFSGDLFLQSYLKRILPSEVGKLFLACFVQSIPKVQFLVIFVFEIHRNEIFQ